VREFERGDAGVVAKLRKRLNVEADNERRPVDFGARDEIDSSVSRG